MKEVCILSILLDTGASKQGRVYFIGTDGMRETQSQSGQQTEAARGILIPVVFYVKIRL
ncbi:MAG: hypothetical protein ACYT04_49695 [Nostoc sp.]